MMNEEVKQSCFWFPCKSHRFYISKVAKKCFKNKEYWSTLGKFRQKKIWRAGGPAVRQEIAFLLNQVDSHYAVIKQPDRFREVG